MEAEIKTFRDKQKVREFFANRPSLKKTKENSTG